MSNQLKVEKEQMLSLFNEFKVMGDTFKVLYISDLHIDLWKFARKKTIAELIRDIFNGVPKNVFFDFIIIAGDLTNKIETATYFFQRLLKKMYSRYELRQTKIIYILGNHELSGYRTINECYIAYHELEKIIPNLSVLTNQIYFYVSSCDIREIKNKYNPSCLVLGGVGFSKFNEFYNADTLIYSCDIAKHHKDREIPECEKFYELYKTTLAKAKELNIPLIVVTHTPIVDWLPPKESDSQCIYFYGHNHQSENEHSKDAFIIANNQIGYPENKKGEKNKNKIRFKYIELEKTINPFKQYKDGHYQISLKDYKQYCDYIGLHVEGIKTIQKRLDKDGILWMIKKSGAYGFFVICNDKTYICRGGTLKKSSNKTDIQYFTDNFPLMILGIISFLSPYYSVLQEISDKIKAAGLSGRIHGCIVDLDYWNHISINPFDGTITRYNSYRVGDALIFNSLSAMKKHILYYNQMTSLEKHNFEKLESTLKSISKTSITDDKEKKLPIVRQKILYGNSIYPISRKCLLLEKILNNHVLQYWDDELLLDIQGISKKETKH